MSAAIDVGAERAATPGCAHVAHLNNAGAALPTTATLDTVVAHLHREARHGGYEAAAEVADAYAAVQVSLATLVGAGPDEVTITGSDTHGWGKALWGYALAGGLGPDRRILVDRMAYDSHYLGLLQVCELTGASIDVVPSEPDGTLDLDALSAALGSGNAALVSVTHVGTHRGLVNPVAAAGGLCRAVGVPYYLDACQSIGQLPVDVGRIGCDVLTGTGRKWLRGPRGTGILYVRAGFAEGLRPPGVDGVSALWDDPSHYRLRSGAQRFAEFEVPVALHLGLGTAVDHVLELGIDAIAARVAILGEELRAQLGALAGVTVHDGGKERCGIVTFTVDGSGPVAVKEAASSAGVNLSVTEASAARLDLAAPGPTTVVRASPHYYNAEDELGRLVNVVAGLTRP